MIPRAWWITTGVLRFHGRHYALEGARPGPRPAHPIGIWLGAAKPRAFAASARLGGTLGEKTIDLAFEAA